MHYLVCREWDHSPPWRQEDSSAPVGPWEQFESTGEGWDTLEQSFLAGAMYLFLWWHCLTHYVPLHTSQCYCRTVFSEAVAWGAHCAVMGNFPHCLCPKWHNFIKHRFTTRMRSSPSGLSLSQDSAIPSYPHIFAVWQIFASDLCQILGVQQAWSTYAYYFLFWTALFFPMWQHHIDPLKGH